MNAKYDITGKTFGYLTVICQDESTIGERNSKWICKCECGNESITTRGSLISGHTTSCGCKRYESRNFTHKMSNTRLYSIWNGMKNRCRNPKTICWSSYGGKGIKVCDEWSNSFLAFYHWSVNSGYDESLTLERIDISRDYCPENCIWIPRNAQARNKSNTVYIDFNGQRKPLVSLCEEFQFPYVTARRRYARLKSKGKQISLDYLFAPIQENKISKRYKT